MRDLENIGTDGTSGEQRLCLAFGVAGEEGRSFFNANAQNDRAVVFCGTAERAIGNDGPDPRRAKPNPIAVAHQMDRNASLRGGVEKPLCAVTAKASR